jgi:ketosteroid isomerase-like protein
MREARPMPAADVMRRYREAAGRGDFDAAFGMYAEDIVFRIPGNSAHAGEHTGREAAIAYINAARALSRDHEVELEVVDALVSEERFCLIVAERFHVDGAITEIRRANVYRVRGDEIVEVWIFEADQDAADRLFADAS